VPAGGSGAGGRRPAWQARPDIGLLARATDDEAGQERCAHCERQRVLARLFLIVEALVDLVRSGLLGLLDCYAWSLGSVALSSVWALVPAAAVLVSPLWPVSSRSRLSTFGFGCH
jgi:hypothetical protein